MTKEEKVLLIPKIENGIVIDHIPVGKGIPVLVTIRSYPEMKNVTVTLGLNLVSTKLGHKDMIKLQIGHLPERVLEHISVICPGMSVKRITDYEVDKKYVLRPPATITRLARCMNPNCVTNHERHLTTRFCAVDPECMKYRCAYCERVFHLGELELVVVP
ncbi:MAG: aspartate carbamoyltransferase regulatory subunit [Bradymonadales bacterium]|nr:aspartate carbamoyltransferase regulatory subunit [Bradymonadales bacterium]